MGNKQKKGKYQSIADLLLSKTYSDEKIQKLISIYYRTKKQRIKTKLFKRLFLLCLNERPVIVFKEEKIVLMKYSVFQSIVNTIRSDSLVSSEILPDLEDQLP